MQQTAAPNRYSVEAVARVARISALFLPTRGVLELAEIVRLAGIPRRTAAKIVATTEGCELLSRANSAKAWGFEPAPRCSRRSCYTLNLGCAVARQVFCDR